MIQNADDAGATVVQFYVDGRQHGTSSLVKPELEAYQGPALISANDAMFSEQDWEGIQSLQQSIKAEDPFKVGRFGIGFNSVYHLTGTFCHLCAERKCWGHVCTHVLRSTRRNNVDACPSHTPSN